jgi:hypothetical protein
MIYNFYDNKIYKDTNLLDDITRNQLIKELDDHIENVNCHVPGKYLEHALSLGSRKVKNTTCWIKFFTMVRKQLKKYSEIIDNPDVNNMRMSAFWGNRIKYVTEEAYYQAFYPHYLCLHDHKPSELGMIYYLKNISEIYGTLWYHEDREIIFPAEENSIVFCNTNMPHNPFPPPPEITIEHPRYILVAEFKSR